MNNHDRWFAAIVLREAFQSIYDNNDFTASFNKLYPELKGNRAARSDEYDKFGGSIYHVSKNQEVKFLTDIHNSVVVGRCNQVQTPHGDYEVHHTNLSDYLKSCHLIDPADAHKTDGKVYTVSIKGSIKLKGSDVLDENHEMDAVIISSDINFVVQNLHLAIEMSSHWERSWREESMIPNELVILRDGKSMFSIPVQSIVPKNKDLMVTYEPVLGELRVIHATLKDLRSLDPLLTSQQARKARGQLVSHDLGL
jgi:hypothetical protein